MFVLIITLPTLNIAAASTDKSTPVTYSGYTTQQATATPTVIALELSTSNGSHTGVSLTVKVNGKFVILGAIGSGASVDNADPIGGAKVNILGSADQQKWGILGTYTSGTGQNGGLPNGVFVTGFTAPSTPAVYYFAANFLGDSQYTPSHSNVVTLSVTQ